MSHTEIREALRILARGSGVRRASHRLMVEGVDTSPVFLEVLAEEGFVETTVDEVQIRTSERIPAFYVADGVAHFGWIFWEIFSPAKKRKIFGSVHRNAKGDWAIVIGRGRRDILYANPRCRESTDPERPSPL